MYNQKKRGLTFFIITGFVWLVFLPAAIAQDNEATSRTVREKISRTMDVEKGIQKRASEWSDESLELSDRLVRLENEKKQLERQLEKLTLLQRLEEKKYTENKRKQVETERIRNELSTFLDSVLVKLEAHIERDLPFLTAERQARIASLKEMMVDTTESSAEKFRRIFEALQIETEYGTTVEATRQTIMFEGKSVLADVLRLGRISLFCQTLDRRKSGYFNKAEQQWLPLPKDVNTDVANAVSMAKLERSVEIVKLPLGRIVQP